MAAGKPCFPPLLPPGRHVMSVDELRALTVAPFAASTTRGALFSELERLIGDLVHLAGSADSVFFCDAKSEVSPVCHR